MLCEDNIEKLDTRSMGFSREPLPNTGVSLENPIKYQEVENGGNAKALVFLRYRRIYI
jgi:hypothetical protein